MSNDKVECQCCGKWMVPRVITSAPTYMSGMPFGGRTPEYSICPFCMSPKWMVTEQQVNVGANANKEFYAILLLAILNIVAFSRLGVELGGAFMVMSILAFLFRARIKKSLQNLLRQKTFRK